MGGGNGNKAAQKRQRNMDKNKPVAGSQLKTNEAAKTIVCALCKQNFLGTMRKPALSEHAEVYIPHQYLRLTLRRIGIQKRLKVSNKPWHLSGVSNALDCFPSYVEPPK
jgi:hypothetical protein